MGKALMVMAVVGLAACPGGKPDCSQPFSACGGNVVGTWHLQGICNSAAIYGCDVQTSSPTATFTFNSDGTFVTAANSTNATLTYPASCFAPGATLANATCAQLGTSLMSAGVGSCSGAVGSDCVCSIMTSTSAMYSGTYTISGSQIMIAGTAGDLGATTAGFDYCVSGDQLRISIKSAGAMPTVEVFTR
jgi:hypothetical protein